MVNDVFNRETTSSTENSNQLPHVRIKCDGVPDFRPRRLTPPVYASIPAFKHAWVVRFQRSHSSVTVEVYARLRFKGEELRWLTGSNVSFVLSNLRKAMAAEVAIHQIQQSSLPAPVRVRVNRKWLIYKRRKWGSYLLIDKHGNTMHAMYMQADKEVLESKINVMECYIFDDYVCEYAPTKMRVASHKAAIKIDGVATITMIDDDSSIPREWFNFLPYSQLRNRMDQIDYLIDFIGKVEEIEHIDTENNNSLLRVTMKAASGDPIVVALWREIVALVDTQALAATDRVVIVALSSVKVVNFGGNMELESTSASRVVVSPNLKIAHEMTLSFQLPVATDEPRIKYTPRLSERDRMTLASLYQEDMNKIHDIKCSCEATITDITRGRPWFFVRCIPCKRTITLAQDGYKCPRHGEAGLKYR
ncbi:hypothetical protein SSX86_033118 [Deinandra increscens subsp. villosa]|uniref:Replication factor A C-terminal domain-containing protein n=1 Tax=Deinandra increscens subsp. villosa TaxID=3103831 RepID=A0AAP0C2S5_9ASTR